MNRNGRKRRRRRRRRKRRRRRMERKRRRVWYICITLKNALALYFYVGCLGASPEKH